MRKPRGYWTYDKCKEEALKYDYVIDFINGSNGAYQKSWKQKWLGDICFHMKPSGNMIKRCIYVYEFNDNHAYIGLTYNIDKRHKQRLINNNDSVTTHIKKTKIEPIRKQLTDYIDIDDAIKMEEYYVNYYSENGWYILNKVKTGSIGGNKIKWDYNTCKEEALKYDTLLEMRKYSKKALDIIYKNKWNDELFKHMNIATRISWSFDKCKKEAIKYTNRKEFQNKNKSAYNYALKQHILDDICKHMTLLHGVKWDIDKCHKYALNYNTKNEFRKKSYTAYNIARVNGWLNNITRHMKKMKKT